MNDNNLGILDPQGINNNPLTDKPYSEEYKELGKIWSQFPAYTNVKYAQNIILCCKKLLMGLFCLRLTS